MMDFRLSTGLVSHPKMVKLRRKLGAEGPLGFIYLLAHVAEYKHDGILRGMGEEDIAIAAQWEGEPTAFVGALLEFRLLEKRGRHFQIHDWAEHNPYAAAFPKRSESARKAANLRWNKDNQDTSRINPHSGSHAEIENRNAPSPIPDPSPTPDPSPEEKEPTALVAAPQPSANGNGNGNGNGSAIATVSPEDLVEGWNRLCVPFGLAQVRELSGSRRKKALLRLHEHPRPEFWEFVFGGIRASPFLRGLGKPRHDGQKPFRASFDWLIENDTNALKVREGKYVD